MNAVTSETMDLVFDELNKARELLNQMEQVGAQDEAGKLLIERQRGVVDGLELIELLLGNL